MVHLKSVKNQYTSKSPETPRKSGNLRNGSPVERGETRTSKATEVPKTRKTPKKSEAQKAYQRLITDTGVSLSFLTHMAPMALKTVDTTAYISPSDILS